MLTITATPQQIDGRGRLALLSVAARDANGQPGTGLVRMITSAGAFSDGTDRTFLALANGTAGIGYTCNATVDRNCVGEVRIDASWGGVRYVLSLTISREHSDGGTPDGGDENDGYLSLTASKSPMFTNLSDRSIVTAQLSPDAGAVAGQWIGFSANNGRFALSDGGSASSMAAPTDVDGKAVAHFRDNGVPGGARIVATHVLSRSIASLTVPILRGRSPYSDAMSDFNVDVSNWPVAVETEDTASSREMIANINTADHTPGHESSRASLSVGLFGDPFEGESDEAGPYMNYEGKGLVPVSRDQARVSVNIYLYSTVSDGVDHRTGRMIPNFWPIPSNVIAEPRWIQGGWPGNDVSLEISPGRLTRSGSAVTATTSSPSFIRAGQTVTLSPGDPDFPPGPKTITTAWVHGFTYVEGGTDNVASTATMTFTVDRPAPEDRHLQIYDVDQNIVYELFWVHFGWPVANMWNAGSGAVFDLSARTHTRPSCPVDADGCRGWGSADASGLPMTPGHVFYDEIFTLPEEIQHGFSCVISIIRRAPRAGDDWTQPYVWPASHTDGTGVHRDGPPMGTRLRLKSVDEIIHMGGPNISDPGLYTLAQQRFLRALQRYGFIITDTLGGAADFVTMSGIYDDRWNQLGPETSRVTLTREWTAKFSGDRSIFPNAVPFLIDYFDVLQPGCGAPGSRCP